MVNEGSTLVRLREGRAEFLAPSGYNLKGPGRRTGEAFYNRQMELNRDVCISLLRTEGRHLKVLDTMAATGVRSARMALEVEPVPEIVANDSNPAATALMKLNFTGPRLEAITLRTAKAAVAMAEGNYDYIDIDPFGTPVRYMPQALMSVISGGLVGITATDSAMLCGSARGSERRYFAAPGRWPFMHEIGVRNLIGYIVRLGASYDRAVFPVLSYFADHYFRIYVRVRNGVKLAEKQLQQLEFAHYDRKTGRRWMSGERTADAAGPAWSGRLHDTDILAAMRVESWFGTAQRFTKMLNLWKGEATAPQLFYNMDEMSRIFGFNLPSMDETLRLLSSVGTACRTHFDPKGFKTSADLDSLRKLLAASRAKGISGVHS